MLQIAGVDLVVDNREDEAESFIRKYIPTTAYMPWLRDSWPGYGLSALSYPNGFRPEPKFELNTFRWPTGASRWAYGHFLAASSQVSSIAEKAYGQNGSFNLVDFKLGSETIQPGKDGTTIGETVSTQVYVLAPVPLSQYISFDYDQLYLLTIVDQRYFWWWKNMGDVAISSSTTWSSLYSTISSALGITFTNDTIDPAYLAPSTMFALPYEPIPRIFDAVAFNVGQRVVVSYDGTVKAQNYTTASKILQDQFSNDFTRYLLAGGQRFDIP